MKLLIDGLGIDEGRKTILSIVGAGPQLYLRVESPPDETGHIWIGAMDSCFELKKFFKKARERMEIKRKAKK